MTTSLITNSRKALPYAPPPVRVRTTVRRETPAAPAAPVFRGANLDAQAITASEWILAGPSETGKTFAALWRLDTEARQWPHSQWAIVRKIRAHMDSSVLVTWRRIIALRGGVVAFGGEKPQWYDYPNGARVWVAGLDNPGKVLSSERDGVYVNQAEELDVEDWETLSTRTTGRGAVTTTPMLFGDCNPGPPHHWILERAKNRSLRLLVSRHEDNPTLHDGREWTAQGRLSLAALDALTGPRHARLRLGEWVDDQTPESFLPDMHLWDACRADLPPLDSRQPLILALDAAVVDDTFAIVGVARHPDQPDDLAVRLVRVYAPHGTALDYGAIEQDIRDLADRLNIVCLAYDPCQAHYLTQRLQDRLWIDPFPQGADRLEADRQLFDLILQRRISHDGDATLRQHIANADRKLDGDGRRLRIIKGCGKIDAAVALSMACHRALSLNVW